jgi:OmpW family
MVRLDSGVAGHQKEISMAARARNRHDVIPALLVLAAVACLPPRVSNADNPDQSAVFVADADVMHGARAVWKDSTSRLEAALRQVRHKARGGKPDWLRHRSGTDPLALDTSHGSSLTRLVVQDDRPDGADLLTVRYMVDDRGALQAYAGAGLNRAEYFVDGPEPAPALMTRGNRRSSLGAAAEIGAELAISEHVVLGADLRWVELDGRANALRSEYGPVSADPLLLGISLGYRFR